MKRKIIALLMATVCATTFFAACDEQASSSDLSEVKCDVHTDTDKDALCDACGKAIVVIKEEIPAEQEQKVDMVVNPIPAEAVMSDYIVSTVEKEVMPTTGWTQSAILKELVDGLEAEKIADFGASPINEQLMGIMYTEVEKVTEAGAEVTKCTEKIMVYDCVNDKAVFTWASDTYKEDETPKKSIEYFDFETSGGLYTVLTCTEAEVKDDTSTTDPDDTVTEYTDRTLVYSSFAGKEIFRFDTQAYEEGDDYVEECDVEFLNGVLATVIIKWEKDSNNSNRYEEAMEFTFYLPDGSEIVTGDEEEITEAPTVEFTADIAYITIGDTKYAYDKETLALLHKEDKGMFIERPTFDEKNEKYGYVFQGDDIYVYDLTKWLDCVYAFTMPSYWNNAKSMVLENGNILVQYERALPAEAVSYDYLIGSAKYDVVYTIINVADGTQKNVEFGYMIQGFKLGSDYEEKYTDKALNVVTVNPIEEQEINSNEKLTLIVDNELNILYSEEPKLAGQREDMDLLANNRFLTTIGYAEGTEIRAIVNEKGELVAKLPSNAEVDFGVDYIKIGTKIYDFDMNEKLDTADYDTAVCDLEYVYLTKSFEATEATETTEATEAYTEAYIYTISMAEPKKIADDAANVVPHTANEAWYQVAKVTVENEGEEDETTKTTYVVYNLNGELVGEFDYKVIAYDEATETTPARITLENGMYYFIK